MMFVLKLANKYVINFLALQMIFFFLLTTYCDLLFIKQFNNQQGIKRLEQIQKDYIEVHSAFSDDKVNDEHIILETSIYDVFKLYKNTELVASIYLCKRKYFSTVPSIFPLLRPSLKIEDGVEIYSLYVNDKFRSKGYARLLIYKALKEMKDHYNLSTDYIVGLHLNNSDEFMNVSFALYYSMNFRRGTFVKYGPSCYAPNFSEYLNFKNPVDIINNPNISKDNGCFFAMYTKYREVLPFNIIRNKQLFNLGQKLRKELKSRKERVN
jgi:ribosomal protein S18 acetylase RimI-like enzyme